MPSVPSPYRRRGYRPAVETLEDRLPPGDLLGLAVLDPADAPTPEPRRPADQGKRAALPTEAAMVWTRPLPVRLVLARRLAEGSTMCTWRS